MLRVSLPSGYEPERAYVVDVLLGEFLGLEFTRVVDPAQSDILITDGQRRLAISDVFFQTPAEQWLRPASLPELPLAAWDAGALGGAADLPVLLGREAPGGGYYAAADDGAYLGLDVFGSAFFLLSRYEEVAIPHPDEHERFTASASLATRGGFLPRPLVNEYLDVLWEALQRCFPRLTRKSRQYRVLLSHDVDQPFGGAGRSLPRVLRSMAGDRKKGRPLALASKRLGAWLTRNFDHDPCNTFAFLMDESKQRGLRNAFYFICGHSGGEVDGDYDLAHPRIVALMQRLHSRGHEIGLHPSYNTFRDGLQLQAEYRRLREVCAAAGIEQEQWGGRQHYFRWQNPITWRLWDEAGLDYDTTMTFTDHVGFRSGVCYEHPVFDLETRRQLRLRERPLVIMEASLWNYMGLREDDLEASLEQFITLARTCRRHQGDFTVLWHNSSFHYAVQRELYRQVLSAVC